MRAMRTALVSVRSMSATALPVPLRPSARARAPSRHASSASTPLSKHIEQFVPTAAILTLILAVSSVHAYYYGKLVSLKAEIEITAATLKKQIEGTAATLKAEIEGTAATLKSDMADTASTLQERVAGIEKAADLKVRIPPARDVHARPASSLTCLPVPLQYKTKTK